MCIKKTYNWCLENYKKLLAVGALLAIIYYLLEIINKVGITIDFPKYFQYFDALDPNVKIYTLAAANFIFTIVFVLLMTTANKKKDNKKK
jgi:hypothetical protein